jgi:hypothetical protein
MSDFDSEKNSELGRKLSIDCTEYFVTFQIETNN